MLANGRDTESIRRLYEQAERAGTVERKTRSTGSLRTSLLRRFGATA